MPSTYTPIATTTLGSSTNTITFSSISGSYTDIVVAGLWRDTVSGSALKIRLNSDTGSNYSYTFVRGNGTTASSNRGSNLTSMYGGEDVSTASTFSAFLMNIQNYSNTTNNKTSLVRNNPPGTDTMAIVNLWRSTAAITSVTFFVDNNFAVGTTFTLYGVKSA